MQNIISRYFKISSPHVRFCGELVNSLINARKVSSNRLAMYVSGSAKIESKIRRIERFFSKQYLSRSKLKDAIHNMFGERRFILSLDRTNWQYGETDVNAFAAFGTSGDVGSLINLSMLDNNGGNSNTSQRIEMESILF